MVKKHLARLQWKAHIAPLLILGIAAFIGQAATLMQHPLVATWDDTYSYTVMAQTILASPKGLIGATRTPGYPLFLAVVYHFWGVDQFKSVLNVQIGIALLAVVECYMLAFRLSQRRVIACLAASAVAINLYIIGWEREILSEALSWWSLITLFLCYERYIRRPGLAWGIVVAIAGFAAIMVRPSNLLIPFFLLFVALLKALWTHEVRRHWMSLALAVIILCIGLGSYMELNLRYNDYFGLSYVTNGNAFGKILEYHMDDLPVPPQYAAIQADAHALVIHNETDPWTFMRYYQAKGYNANYWALPGSYARYIILHNFGAFLVDSIHDFPKIWLAPPQFYPHYGTDLSWVNTLIKASAAELDLYLLLPILLIGLGVWVWRHPQDKERFLLFVLGLTILVGLGTTTLGAYVDFYRIRSPFDWAMILLGSIVLAEVVTYALRQVSQLLQKQPIPVVSHSELELSINERQRNS